MLNYIFNWFSKPEKNPEPLFFGGMNEKLQELDTLLTKASSGPGEQYTIQLSQQIYRELQTLKNYVSQTKIYIVLLGTTSAGKSTFINSLLGQQLLPSRNQECTSQILFITHNDKLTINNKTFNHLDQASQYLFECQKNDKFEIINIQTQSLFHSQLPPDLQDRVVFVDTPGIKLSEQQKLKAHFSEIDNRIGNHHRINVWICNYTTFDSDKDLQNQILSIYQPLLHSEKSKKQISFLREVIEEDEKITQARSQFIADSGEMIESKQEWKLAPLLFVLNKYDERRESEDSNVDVTIKEICKTIGNEDLIYKISALRSLRYQIMNSNNKQAKDKFIQSYFIDNRDIEFFQNKEECRIFCEQKIKNNHNLMQAQDYSKFQNNLICLIKQQINQGFYGDALNSIGQQLIFLNILMNPQCIKLSAKKMDLLKEFVGKFIENQIQIYKEWILKFSNEAKTSIEQIVQNQKLKLISVDPAIVLKEACQQTIDVFAEFDQKINELNKKTKQAVMDKLTQIFEPIQPIFGSVEILGPVNRTLEGCLKLYELLGDDQIYEIQKTSFEQYASDLQRTLGVQINTLQKSIGLVTTGISLITFLGRRFVMSTMFCTPVFAAIGLGLLAIDFDMVFGRKWYSPQVVEQSLQQWKLSLISQINSMHDNYIQVNISTLNSQKSLLLNLME